MKTLDDVVTTLRQLGTDLAENPEGWENPTLERYLEAMAAWMGSAKAREIEQPTWDLACQMLVAASIYE